MKCKIWLRQIMHIDLANGLTMSVLVYLLFLRTLTTGRIKIKVLTTFQIKFQVVYGKN